MIPYLIVFVFYVLSCLLLIGSRLNAIERRIGMEAFNRDLPKSERP